MSLSQKIVQIRKMKGMSQEELSTKAGISLRTLQRIEKEESEPRGHTLRAITEVLEVPVEELMDFSKTEDRPLVLTMTLSPLAYFFMPILNILLPLVFWLFRREKVRDVDKVGRQIISFQIIWSILTYGVPLLLFITSPIFGPITHGFPYFMFFLLSYWMNAVFIIISAIRLRRGKNWIYVIPLKFV